MNVLGRDWVRLVLTLVMWDLKIVRNGVFGSGSVGFEQGGRRNTDKPKGRQTDGVLNRIKLIVYCARPLFVPSSYDFAMSP
jgi:hypothetical protein